MRIGVIGLGSMGNPIAVALSTRHEVLVFDADQQRMTEAASSHLSPAPSLADAVARSEVVVTVLPGPAQTSSVILESLPAFALGSCWLDLATGDPQVTLHLGEQLATRAVCSVAAPMGGGPRAAAGKALHFTVAGQPTAVTRIAPLLEVLAAPDGVDVIGDDPSHAQTVKLLSNVLWFGQVVAVTEAMLLGRALGLDPVRLRGMLAERAGGSVLLERDYAAVLQGQYMPSFGIDRVVEQLNTARVLAEAHRVPFELTALVERIHRQTLQRYGPIEGELLAARLLEERSGSMLSGQGRDGDR